MWQKLQAQLRAIVTGIHAFFTFLRGSLWLFWANLPRGLRTQQQLIRHFETRRDALEQVIEQALAVKPCQPQEWAVSATNRSKELSLLTQAMKRAQIKRLWFRKGASGATAFLITDIVYSMLGDTHFGYFWLSNEAIEIDSARLVKFDEEETLDKNWYLYWFTGG